MFSIRKATIEDIPAIQELARTIWQKTYITIISQAQLDYMLDLFYSTELLQQLISQNSQSFFIAFADETPIGYASYSILSPQDSDTYKLHKLYVLTEKQHKGTGSELLQQVIEAAKNLKAKTLILNVNRQNTAIDFYIKKGFSILEIVDNEIGNGYYMNDYVMGLDMV